MASKRKGTTPKVEKSASSSDGGSTFASEEEEVEYEVEVSSESDPDDSLSESTANLKTLRKLLQPFSKDQLVAILKEAAETDSSVVTDVTSSMESDPAQRKIFVFGLAIETTTELLISVFKAYGPIEDCNVVSDRLTGRCKGFGFVVFKTRSAAMKALKEPQKKIGSRMTTCQLSAVGVDSERSDIRSRKLHVANVGPGVTPEKLRSFFAKFGEIEDGPIGLDPLSKKFKGYAMFVYKSVEGINNALEEPFKEFDGVMLRCSLALRNNMMAPAASGSTAPAGSNLAVLPSNVGVQGLPMTGMLPQNLNQSGVFLLGQNPTGVVLNSDGNMLPSSYAGGASQGVSRLGSVAQSGLSVPQSVVNPLSSSSIMGDYGSQIGLHGLDSYRTSHLEYPSSAAARSRSGLGLIPSYLTR